MALSHQRSGLLLNVMLSIRSERNFQYCFLFLQVLRCFTSLRTLPHTRVTADDSGVSPFGHFRVKGYLAPRRNLSQPYHVLHRSLKPRHPPYTLTFLQGMLYTAVQFNLSVSGDTYSGLIFVLSVGDEKTRVRCLAALCWINPNRLPGVGCLPLARDTHPTRLVGVDSTPGLFESPPYQG